MNDAVLLDRQGSIAILTLNRPDKRNAIGDAIREALVPLLGEITADPSCRAVVLTGAGGAFCSGGDLGEMRPRSMLERRARLEGWRSAIHLITRGPKVFVAAVDGPAYGAGFSLALLCDQVVAGPTARFSAAFVKVGLMPDLGLLWSLPGRVGLGRAKALLLSGSAVDAAEAVQLGIADHLAPEGATLDEAIRCASLFADAAPGSVSQIKAALARGPARLEEVLDWELDGQPLLACTEDHQEGKLAFLERRPARFKGT